ncbi:uncharacterized protein LOC107039410 isoform X2 [Diachasma alloeum]|uniref:uncharacterized protein LOC107039410 isoform X2 n=1 Tax=Diachasma alloeum TaxID=454923 RepID=UPI00073810B5|nr:uncharacterized protein LOC107039410 isoform X2 [Diachasma alloeum]
MAGQDEERKREENKGDDNKDKDVADKVLNDLCTALQEWLDESEILGASAFLPTEPSEGAPSESLQLSEKDKNQRDEEGDKESKRQQIKKEESEDEIITMKKSEYTALMRGLNKVQERFAKQDRVILELANSIKAWCLNSAQSMDTTTKFLTDMNEKLINMESWKQELDRVSRIVDGALSEDEYNESDDSHTRQEEESTRQSQSGDVGHRNANLTERGQIRCFECGDTGHLGNICPNRGMGPKCYHCNRFGHEAFDCPDFEERSRTPNNTHKTGYSHSSKSAWESCGKDGLRKFPKRKNNAKHKHAEDAKRGRYEGKRLGDDKRSDRNKARYQNPAKFGQEVLKQRR